MDIMILRMAIMSVAFPAMPSGCDKDEPVQEQVSVPTEWRLIDVGTWSFRFPKGVDLDGFDDVCGGRNAPNKGCAIAIEGPVYRAAATGFTLQTLDSYGDRGPSNWGLPLRLNGLLVYRKKGVGEDRYVVTDRSGGKDKAVRFSHPNMPAGTQDDPPEQALIWASCKTAQGCSTARAIIASVRFDDISQYCPPIQSKGARHMFPRCPEPHS